jgi:hypothetical protein
LERHTKIFLTEKEWMEVPWQSRPKTFSDRLWDTIAYVPEIFSQTDNFGSMAPVDILTTALRIIDRCWEMDADLQDLYHALESSIPGPIYWPELSTMSNPADDEENGKVFPVAFHFFNLKMAMSLMLYWSTQTIMHNGMVLLYHHVMKTVPVSLMDVYLAEDVHPLLLEGLPPCQEDCICSGMGCIATFDMTKLRPLGLKADFRTPARNICQSAEYCMQEEMLDMGPSSLVAPLSVVVETLQLYDFCRKEVEWGRHVLRKIEDGWLPYLKCVRLAKTEEKAISR